jgi:hypothetical protein
MSGRPFQQMINFFSRVSVVKTVDKISASNGKASSFCNPKNCDIIQQTTLHSYQEMVDCVLV